jgi:hypothetical protein
MWDGTLHAPVQQVALSIFPEPCGGSAIAQTVPVDTAMVSQLETMLNGLGWEGIVQLQSIRIDDEDFVIDLNPRIYGSLALANAAGSSLASVWVNHLLGLPVSGGRARTDVTYRNFETFLRSSGPLRLRGMTPGGAPEASSVFTGADPLPLVASAARGLRKVVRGAAAGARGRFTK